MKELIKSFWALREEVLKLQKQKRKAVLQWDLTKIETIEGEMQALLIKGDAIIDKMKVHPHNKDL